MIRTIRSHQIDLSLTQEQHTSTTCQCLLSDTPQDLGGDLCVSLLDTNLCVELSEKVHTVAWLHLAQQKLGHLPTLQHLSRPLSHTTAEAVNAAGASDSSSSSTSDAGAAQGVRGSEEASCSGRDLGAPFVQRGSHVRGPKTRMGHFSSLSAAPPSSGESVLSYCVALPDVLSGVQHTHISSTHVSTRACRYTHTHVTQTQVALA